MKTASLVLTAGALALIGQIATGAIILDQLDDFEGGTTKSWSGGVQLSNVPNGGPAGADDNFLRVTQDFSSRKLATYNGTPDWTGDYEATGVTTIEVDMMTTHSTALEIRVVLFGPLTISRADRWTSTVSQTLANDGQWHSIHFSLLQQDLTLVAPVNGIGSGLYQDTITDVRRLMLRHQTGPPMSGGTNITATMNIDNVEAIPEPTSLLILTLFGLVMGCRRFDYLRGGTSGH